MWSLARVANPLKRVSSATGRPFARSTAGNAVFKEIENGYFAELILFSPFRNNAVYFFGNILPIPPPPARTLPVERII